MNDLHADPNRTRVIESVQRKLAELTGAVMPAVRRQCRAALASGRRALRAARSKRTLRF